MYSLRFLCACCSAIAPMYMESFKPFRPTLSPTLGRDTDGYLNAIISSYLCISSQSAVALGQCFRAAHAPALQSQDYVRMLQKDAAFSGADMMQECASKFVSFTMWIAFAEPTWVSMLQRITLRGFQVLSQDVPWAADSEGHREYGRDFAHGIAHFVVLGFRMRCNKFLVNMWPVLEPAVH